MIVQQSTSQVPLGQYFQGHRAFRILRMHIQGLATMLLTWVKKVPERPCAGLYCLLSGLHGLEGL